MLRHDSSVDNLLIEEPQHDNHFSEHVEDVSTPPRTYGQLIITRELSLKLHDNLQSCNPNDRTSRDNLHYQFFLSLSTLIAVDTKHDTPETPLLPILNQPAQDPHIRLQLDDQQQIMLCPPNPETNDNRPVFLRCAAQRHGTGEGFSHSSFLQVQSLMFSISTLRCIRSNTGEPLEKMEDQGDYCRRTKE